VLFLDEPTTGLDPMSRANVWAEIRRLNTELGMTIFLTTQYLDEADVLADRVGIIDRGRVAAEGTPEELKRSLGQDLIVAEVEGDDPTVFASLRLLDGVDAVSSEPGRIVVSTKDGPAELSSVAIALNATSLRVRALTLRTPTLDDVFMELTGSHIHEAVPA
jgi:ABC-2 type transport system ATP-binding protein